MIIPELAKVALVTSRARILRGWCGLENFQYRALGAAVLVQIGASMVSGCISVTAPDKPIVIELNINIKQDVVYSLAPDAKNTIQSNSGIF